MPRVGPGKPVGDVAVRPPLCEEVLEEVRGGGGGLGGEVGEGGVVLHQHTRQSIGRDPVQSESLA